MCSLHLLHRYRLFLWKESLLPPFTCIHHSSFLLLPSSFQIVSLKPLSNNLAINFVKMSFVKMLDDPSDGHQPTWQSCCFPWANFFNTATLLTKWTYSNASELFSNLFTGPSYWLPVINQVHGNGECQWQEANPWRPGEKQDTHAQNNQVSHVMIFHKTNV